MRTMRGGLWMAGSLGLMYLARRNNVKSFSDIKNLFNKGSSQLSKSRSQDSSDSISPSQSSQMTNQSFSEEGAGGI